MEYAEQALESAKRAKKSAEDAMNAFGEEEMWLNHCVRQLNNIRENGNAFLM